jgi:hypothetical protein
MKRVENVIKAMSQIYDKKFTSETMVLFLADLEGYTENQLIEALKKCRKELKFFPSIAEILERIPGGFPGVEEAWSRCPKNERDSVVWTNEIRKAFAISDDLIYNGDMVGARMAFKEKYLQLVSEARAKGLRPIWSISYGDDKTGREAALLEAEKLNALSCNDTLLLNNIKSQNEPCIKMLDLTRTIGKDIND